jgi:hypothetical protein
VQEIAARSLAPGELVLRRLLGGDRREEIFVSKADLKQKLEPLDGTRRALFDPLWAEGGALPARRPPPAPTARLARKTPALGSPLPVPPEHPTEPAAPSTSPRTDQTLREPLPAFDSGSIEIGVDRG